MVQNFFFLFSFIDTVFVLAFYKKKNSFFLVLILYKDRYFQLRKQWQKSNKKNQQISQKNRGDGDFNIIFLVRDFNILIT
jgi:hypothetical protein